MSPPSYKGERHFYLEGVPPVAQKAYQCGPAALEGVFRYWGEEARAEEIARRMRPPGGRGVLNFALAQEAREQGFWAETPPRVDLGMLKGWMRRGIPPVVMLEVGPFGLPIYHFLVLRGFDDARKFFYANTGGEAVQAVPYGRFQRGWEAAGRWCLIVCPPSRVDWDLSWEEAGRLALYLEREERFDRAERWYRYALGRNPQSKMIRFNLANTHLKSRQMDQAEALYRQLLSEEADWAEAANNLAWIHVERGRYEQAVQILEEAISAGAPRDCDLLDTWGVAYCRSRRPDLGRRYLLEALERAPSGDRRRRKIVQGHLEECPPP